MSNVLKFPERPHEQPQEESQAPAETPKGPQVEDGYTRIANELLEQVMAAPFTLREMRVVMAVIRLTYGWNRKQARVTRGLLAKLTGMPETIASKTMAALVAKNVVIRHGGSRSPVSLNKHAGTWSLKPQQRVVPPAKGAKGECEQSDDQEPKQSQREQNALTEREQNALASKDTKDIPPLPSVEGEGASPETGQKPNAEKPQPKAKPKGGTKPKAAKLDLSQLPADVSREAVEGFIEHRKTLKKPLTQRALTLNVDEALRAADRIPGMTADQALDETVMAGWQGVKADWLARRQGASENPAKGMNQAERLHAANQQAIREAVERRNADAEGNGDLFDNDGGHW